jgi:predicted Fe-S protein YdhL (DUF1289 family)
MVAQFRLLLSFFRFDAPCAGCANFDPTSFRIPLPCARCDEERKHWGGGSLGSDHDGLLAMVAQFRLLLSFFRFDAPCAGCANFDPTSFRIPLPCARCDEERKHWGGGSLGSDGRIVLPGHGNHRVQVIV